MRLPISMTTIRRRDAASEATASLASSAEDAAAFNVDEMQPDEMTRVIDAPPVDDALGQVMTELSHDLRQPLTSLRMNIQSAVKLLQQPTPQITSALEALTDCLSTERDMIELVAHARRRAAAMVERENPYAQGNDHGD